MDPFVDARKEIERTFGRPTEEFKKLQNNVDKMRYCYQQVERKQFFLPKVNLAEKCEILATKARNEGNDLFVKKKDFVGALEQYNKSLCLSPSGSENIGICFANRSAVCFQSGWFKLSLENIDLALNHNCPEKIVLKLEARRAKCEQFFNNAENEKKDQQVPVKLSYPANKQIPSIIADLELKQSEEFGRHICAKRNLYPGDIVMIDEPYIKRLDDNAIHKMCNNCHEPQLLNLFPCQFCTNTMYCSPKCEQEAWKRFHKYECGILYYYDYYGRLGFRATLLAFTLFDNLDDLKGLLESTTKEPITDFDLNNENLRESDVLKVIYNLDNNYSKEDEFCKSILAAQTVHLFFTCSKIKQLLLSRDNEDFFLETFSHFFRLSAINAHELHFRSKTPPEIDVEAFGLYMPQKCGYAIFPVISYLNHSCAPNLLRINRNEKMIIMVVRNIKTGEQLFDNYGPHHYSQSKESRQEELLSKYFFKCQCEACINDYLMFKDVEIKGLLNRAELDTKYLKPRDSDIKSALQVFENCKKFLKDNNDHYPCADISTIIGYLQSCSCTLFGNSPLELKLKPFTKIN